MAKRTRVAGKVSGAVRLGDAELVLLSAGSRRDDRLIEMPAEMKPVSRQRAAGNLLKRKLVEELPAGRDQPVWREEDGSGIALRVTDAGSAVIGVEPETSGTADPEASSGPALEQTVKGAPASSVSPPRAGSKGEQVIALLSRPVGAGIDELIAATGWLPHTTRAALTGLRQRGYAITRERDDGGRSRYRIPTAALEAPEPAVEPPAKSKRTRKRAEAEVRAAA